MKAGLIGPMLVNRIRRHVAIALVVCLTLATIPPIGTAQAATPVAWENVPGGLKQVSADATHVWGVNSSSRIYRRPVDGSGNWKQVNGGLKHVSASGNGWIWGVSNTDDIWKCAKPCDTGAWQNVPGKLSQISAGETEVWGVNSNGAIYRRPVDGSGSWQRVRGALKHVSASGRGWIWGVNSREYIYKCAKPCATGAWQPVPGRLSQVDANDTMVWGVNSNDNLFRMSVDGSGAWEGLPGDSLKYVTSSGNSWIWSVDTSDAIFKALQAERVPQDLAEGAPPAVPPTPEPPPQQAEGAAVQSVDTSDAIFKALQAEQVPQDLAEGAPPAVPPTPEPPPQQPEGSAVQVENITWGTVVFSEPDASTAPPAEPLPVPEQADPSIIVIAPSNAEPFAVKMKDYLNSPQSYTSGPNWVGLNTGGFGDVGVPAAVRPVFGNDATAAWLSVPGLYGDGNTDDVYRPFVESAFAAMKEADWDLRGAGSVDEFINKLNSDADLRADFAPFLVVAAYEGLVSEDSSDPARARANAQIRELIGGRVVRWQKYVNQDIRHQWAKWKNKIQVDYEQSFPKYTTLSTLVHLPTGCGNFTVKPPGPLVVSGGGVGKNAVESIFGPAGMIAAAEVASVLETEGGTKWADTPMGRFEVTTGIAVENLNQALAARAATTRIGLGGAVVGVLAATTGGIEKYRLEKMKKLTKVLNDDIKARDLDADRMRQQLQDQISDANKQFADEAAESAGKELGEEAQQELAEKTAKELAEKQAQEIAEKGVKEVSEEVVEKALKEGGEELAEELFEASGKKLSSRIGGRLGAKFGSTLGKVLGAGLSVVGVIANFGELLYETLPCEAFESGVLGNLHEVQPDFRAALVTSREYQTGLLYDYCKSGYSGSATSCIKDGCPYGYSESLLYCTPKVTAKDSYGRGAGRSGKCKPGEELSAGLCYSACPSGYTGVGPVCWSNCPAGHNDTGAFCSKGGQVVSQETYTRAHQSKPMVCSSSQLMEAGLCYQKCKEGYSGVVTDCVQTDCPKGYNNHIATCYRPWPPHSISKKRYPRGVGVVPGSCQPGYERKGALCYPNCASGYLSNALNCDKPCPAGYVDDGLTCRAPIETIAKASSGRELSVPLACSDPAYPSSHGLLCYPDCKEGYTGNGPVCWEDCPATMADTGALCQFIPKKDPVGFAKESYPRGVGTVPQALGTDVDKDGLLDHLDPHFYDRVDAKIGGISAKARQQLLEETFVHLASYFIAEPAAKGRLTIPPIETE